MTKLILILTFVFVSFSSHAADLKRLKKLFVENFDRFYVWRMCGQNIHTLVTEAQKQKIDLRNAFVMNIEGSGIWETSGFYTRGDINRRAMLGYFHVVLYADGHIFDFDLADPIVPNFEDYVRLQFTPPHEPYVHYGSVYDAKNQLQGWSISRYEIDTFNQSQAPETWKKPLRELVNLDRVVKKKRIR
jgi:hypothetical protein